MNSAPASTRQNSTARATFRDPPVTSSANEAMASNPRYDSTATETAPSTAAMENAASPVTGVSHPRCAPSRTRTTTADTTKTSSTAISMASTANPTRAAARTPHRLSSVVTSTATAVHTHRTPRGPGRSSRFPEKR
ncbi:hypothetical protein SBADM41S_09678 [Streptomyces badius]